MNSETQAQFPALSLGIENGLKYIQSQHIGECVYDSIQIILFFADGLRQIFGKYAEHVLNQAYSQKDETGDDKLNLFKIFDLNKLFESIVGNYFGIEATNPHAQYLKSFLARAIRRYIMIKLQDGDWTMEHILQEFGIPSIQTSCLVPFKPSSPSLRRASFNESAGVTTAESLMAIAGKPIKLTKGMFETAGADDMVEIKLITDAIFDGITTPAPSIKSRFTITTAYDATKFGNLVAILIVSYSERGGHANTIIRYRNEFYYCDNNVGMALRLDPPLPNNIELKKDSFKFQYASEDDTRFHFYVNGKEHARGVSSQTSRTDIFLSSDLLYFYTNEPVALEEITPTITSPPKLKPVVVTEPVISNKFTSTSSTYGTYWHRKTSDAKRTFGRIFSKTRRAERPIGRAMIEEGIPSVKRFSKTLRVR